MSPVSLVITVLDEAESIRPWLASLSALETQPDELIVCDGGSKDATLDIIRLWSESAPFPVRVLVAPGANISEGRNRAIAAAAGPWIAVTDAGTTLDTRWLSRLAAAAERTGAAVIGGFTAAAGRTRFERALSTIILYQEYEIDPPAFLPSSRSLLFRKDAWFAAGGYPEELDYCEDLVFDLQLRECGETFAFAPDALVSWSARPSLRAFAKQYFRYGRGDGKAGLWPRRHLIRYACYGVGAAVLIAAPGGLIGSAAALFAGVCGYHARYFRRVWRSALPAREKPAAFALVPVIGVVGDVAKMVGYPFGVAWRRRRERSIAAEGSREFARPNSAAATASQEAA